MESFNNSINNNQINFLDKITGLIILRALFLYELLESGWTVKKLKKNKFEVVKIIKK